MEPCPRCEAGCLERDEVEGFVLCQSCGYVADEYGLQAETQGQGTIVKEDDSGAAALRAISVRHAEDGLSHGVGRGQGRGKAEQRLRAIQDILTLTASNLSCPSSVTAESCRVLKQVYESGSVHLGGSSMSREALCAAVLMVVTKATPMPLSLNQVCAAAQADKKATGNFYKQLSAMNLMGTNNSSFTRPSQGVRAHCIRLAAHFLQQAHQQEQQRPQQQEPTEAQQQPGVQMAVRAQGPVAAAAPVFLSHQELTRHPFVTAALNLGELVVRTGLSEGRPPAIMAGAVLLLLKDSLSLSPPSRMDAEALTAQVHCHKRTLSATLDYLQQQLLQLAALLPMGAAITKANLPRYLHLIIDATHTIVELKQRSLAQQEPGGHPEAAVARQGAPGGVLPRLGSQGQRQGLTWKQPAVGQELAREDAGHAGAGLDYPEVTEAGQEGVHGVAEGLPGGVGRGTVTGGSGAGRPGSKRKVDAAADEGDGVQQEAAARVQTKRGRAGRRAGL